MVEKEKGREKLAKHEGARIDAPPDIPLYKEGTYRYAIVFSTGTFAH